MFANTYLIALNFIIQIELEEKQQQNEINNKSTPIAFSGDFIRRMRKSTNAANCRI